MPKSRPGRKGSIRRAGESQPTTSHEELTMSTNRVGEQNEELQSLKSAVQLLAEQQAVQAQCMNQLMNKIKADVPSNAAAEQDVEFPSPRNPTNFQLRSGALKGEQEASNGSENPVSADVLDDTDDGSHYHYKDTKSSKARMGEESKDLQNWVAWKWRWAVEANKKKELSQRINELNNSKRRVNKEATRNNNHTKDKSRSKDGSIPARGFITQSAELSLKALPASLSSPMHSPLVQAFENGNSGWKASTQIENLQKQVLQLTACFNKMMPTLVFLVNRAGSQKFVNHCFSQWKALSNMKSNEDHRLRRENNPSIKPCSRVLKGLGIPPVIDSSFQRQRVQRKASMTEYIQPKFERMSYVSNSATLKAINTLQVSLNHELQELQGIMTSEMENLKRQVEARRPPQSVKRYGGGGEGSRWKNDLLMVWELCNNVAQLLNKARYKLTTNGELPAAVQPRSGRVPIQPRNRHQYACHPIISVTTSEPHRGTLCSSSAAPIIRIITPEPPHGTWPPPAAPIDKVLAFIQQFDAAFGDEGFMESSKLHHVAMHFQKSARQWWASLWANGKAPQTQKNLRASIMKQFLSSNAKDKVLTKWQSLKLAPYESIHKYMDKFWDLHLKATVYKKIDFEEQKQQFCAGLLKEMNKYVISQRPKTILVVIHHTMLAARINFQQGAKRNLKPMEVKEKHEPKGKNHPQNSSKGNSSNNKAKEKGVYKGKNRLTLEELERYRKDN
ncbi:hypothetical protein L7F22_013599 [Adiantum nelumboides]|nr:hypothetical protein [Adiantum nelumboides]